MNDQLQIPLPVHLKGYPERPGAKSGDTSAEAAVKIGRTAETLRDLVLNELKTWPCTADEVAAILEESVLSIRPRLSELHKQKLIEKTGRRRANKSGMMANEWRVT